MGNPQKRTTYDWILETVSVLALLWSFCPLLFYGRLDDETLIPIHYNLDGEIDGWGERYFLWIIPLIALVFYIGLSVFEKYYKRSNYPYKTTEKNANYLYRQRVQLSRHLKFFSILIFAYLNNSSYAIATGNGSGLSKFIMIFLMAGLFISLIFFYVRME
ncbi:MAG: DUF1648 domain-containing protein [Prevotellaceae bacterium]|jgi:hypothetical protein|nr:DUF1648 domain-containing protein [Prevotellaceae bacterium]